jgi:hypothetical protein
VKAGGMMFASIFKSNHRHHNPLLLPKANLTCGNEKKEREHSPKRNKSAPITHHCGDNCHHSYHLYCSNGPFSGFQSGVLALSSERQSRVALLLNLLDLLNVPFMIGGFHCRCLQHEIL